MRHSITHFARQRIGIAQFIGVFARHLIPEMTARHAPPVNQLQVTNK